ncbi:PREDICTED: transmembrane protein 92-like [Elephantulus edwardii]|uniref:transmembrane protein 92-like n=1 Tax=Elephantulus edwardii TaxID=28737 RepID=UPI0003F0EE9D|nr:PREDICTED: transmembrane protein 92-like [Elephantulus edwardii]
MVGPLSSALLLCLLASLHQVSAQCDFLLKCTKCCGDRCCEHEDVVPKPLIILIFILLLLIMLVLTEYLCGNCKPLENSSPPVQYVEPISVLSSGDLPQETSIYTSELLPPYSEIVQMPFMDLPPLEPPPPYSARPEEHPGVPKDITTLPSEPHTHQ